MSVAESLLAGNKRSVAGFPLQARGKLLSCIDGALE